MPTKLFYHSFQKDKASRGIKWDGKTLVNQDRDSLLKQKQRLYGEAKENKIFSSSHWQMMSSHFLRSRASVCIAVAPENKGHNNKHPPFTLFFLLDVVLRRYHMDGISLWSGWVSCFGYVPFQDFAHHHRTDEGECWRHTLMLWEHCSAVARTREYYPHLSS